MFENDNDGAGEGDGQRGCSNEELTGTRHPPIVSHPPE